MGPVNSASAPGPVTACKGAPAIFGNCAGSSADSFRELLPCQKHPKAEALPARQVSRYFAYCAGLASNLVLQPFEQK